MIQDGEGLKEFLGSRPRPIKRLLRDRFDKRITNVEVCRTPINRGLKKALNLLSGGQIKRVSNRLAYDDIYHLYLVLTLDNGERYSIEKNQVVKVQKNPPKRRHTECRSKALKDPPTLIDFIRRGERKDGLNHYRYSAFKYNCQRFLKTLLNGIGVHDFDEFILQDADQLLRGKSRAVAQALTDIAGVGTRVKQEAQDTLLKLKNRVFGVRRMDPAAVNE